MTYLGSFGIAATTADLLWAEAEKKGGITKETLAAAEKVAGLEFSEAEREMMLDGVEELTKKYAALRAVKLDNSVAPALHFRARLPEMPAKTRRRRAGGQRAARVERPANVEDLAFAPVTTLARLIRAGKVRSQELTELYLARLKRYNPVLNCVVTLTEQRALAQAARADRELAAGRYRGPLHGIPWGAKDLIAVKGYPTTWGAPPYRDQLIDEDATVVQRLDAAGAVLVAKLTLGSLATGDIWFGGQTCSPWNPSDGSSGSSAGPASAVAAGLVGFAVGSETRGSILSPCTRCGATGLRPTFGRVSRHGAMALAWSMDKLGPICRSVSDCALVLAAVAGPDDHDETVVDAPFDWDPPRDVRTLRVGWLKSIFERELTPDDDPEWARLDLAAVDAVRSLGVELVPIELPDLPIDALSFILNAESAAAFDDLTRSGRDHLLVRQGKNDWPNRFRTGRTIPAVEYIQANRVRRLAMREMDRILSGLDAYLSPTYGGANLLLTNLTGHPAVVLPSGFRDTGTPVSITVMGNLFADAEALLLAKAYQDVTGFHLKRPRL
jgi:Asp-tRNA(Asn)/Glu-tRNA(Gln) amidotransferase A subunit family amidase